MKTKTWLVLVAATIILAVTAPVAAGNGATLLLGVMVTAVIATRPQPEKETQ